jgi:hypothetical protein
MKNIFKYFFYVVLFFILLILFLPKENIYYFIVNQFKNYKVEILQKDLKNDILSISTTNTTVKYNSIKVANISTILFDTSIYKTNFSVDDITIDSSFKRFIPTKIDHIDMRYNILNPLSVDMKLNFNYGICKGKVDIYKSKISIECSVSKKFKNKYRTIVKKMIYKNNRSDKKTEVYSFEYKY